MEGEVTTWSCGHLDSVGDLCGLQTQSDDYPNQTCLIGHHKSHWTLTPLWRCEHAGRGDIDPCGDLRLALDSPTSPCHFRHEGAWRRVDEFAPEVVPVTVAPDVGERRVHDGASKSPVPQPSTRVRMPTQRAGFTRRFRLRYTHKDGRPDVMRLYFTANVYENGLVGEVFVKAGRVGTLASGALDSAAIMISLLLQHGVPLSMVTSKLRHTRFEPSGFTGDPEFPSCSSPLDLLAQWLERKFGETP